ncbi:NADH dehydrogenase [ubiquinone] 1 beta subcomplex subunit 10 [Myzus persicae]|uniref:NADH dehydrogenase [ubiquinone] 1 beta subcomplex subunit 10 n=1 Tax=Myzus persicae TaxID=13164 RepID=UPI000B937A6D|nr:NADH dehydrogenase [ubiquinone] 1 beta subcomplex subunit 10 [Myzus persicae]
MSSDSDTMPGKIFGYEKQVHTGRNSIEDFLENLKGVFLGPAIWVRETIVKPNQKDYNYYHEQLRRVPTVDQCYDDDRLCKWEANQQLIRDKLVDSNILSILRQRYEDCRIYEAPDGMRKCKPLSDIYQEAEENYSIKYGDLGVAVTAERCYAKQLNRMLWERRHGPVGTGMKKDSL